MYDVIILGSGPAGLTAGIYTSRGGKKTLILGGNVLGGQTSGISKLENYSGFIGSGSELIEIMKKQTEQFGCSLIFETATSINGNFKTGFEVSTMNNKYTSKTIIIATGASPRKLNITGAKELFGKGVSYCATCDGFFYSNLDVAVIGGGNSAINDALYLSDIAKNVTIIYRKNSFTRVEKILIDRIKEKNNISYLFNTELTSLSKQDNKILALTNNNKNLIFDGIFVEIGHEANTDFLSEDIKRDELGKLIKSELPKGMFIAGDIVSKLKMQIATAVGSGCEAGMDAVALINSSN